MTRIYATLFDKNYRAKGLSLLSSLSKHSSEQYVVNVLALDEETAKTLRALEMSNNVIVHELKDVTTPALETARGNRTHQEFCWTLASYYTNWIAEQGVPEVTYLDSDLYFYNDPKIAHDDMQQKQVGITPHRFIPAKKYLEVNGIFNVGWVSFKRLEPKSTGRRVLRQWRDQCLDWCYNRNEGEKYADQKYLNAWPNYGGCCIHIVNHIGIGLAPWNLAQYQLTEKEGRPHVNGIPVVFYHFHEFAELPNNEFRLTYYHLRPYDISTLYEPYIKTYREMRALIALTEKGSAC